MNRSRIVEGRGELPRPFVAEEPDRKSADAERSAAGEPQPDPVAEAHERGRRQGQQEGRRAAATELDARAADLRRQVGQSLKHLAGLHRKLELEHTEAMKQLALEAAMRIVRERIDADDPVAARALREALDALPGGENLRVRMHPDDRRAIEAELVEEIEAGRIDLSASENISRGGCIVESASGTLDATVETATRTVTSAVEGNTEAE